MGRWSWPWMVRVHKVGIPRTGPVGAGPAVKCLGEASDSLGHRLVIRGEAGLEMRGAGSESLSGSYVTRVANRGLTIALGTPPPGYGEGAA